jgi:hypothetical protein
VRVRGSSHRFDRHHHQGLTMFDLYTEQRKAMLKKLYEYVDSHEERIARAKEALGDKYLLAPCNRVQRRATPYGSIR